MKAWYERDDFWQIMYPKIFDQDRWTSAKEEVESIISLLGIELGDSILDLCCGPGRHSLELARRGYRVTGVDRTLSYLEKARRQAKTEGLKIEFIQDDMRNFCRPGTFDAALNLYSSFGYFEDQEDDRRVIKNLNKSIKSGGRLIMEMMGKEVLARIFRERDWHEENGVLFLEERKINSGWGCIQARWVMIKGKEINEFIVSHRLYSGEELAALLLDSDFKTVKLFGDLSGAPYDHTAQRLVAIAFK